VRKVEHSGQSLYVADATVDGMFRSLSPEEACDFRAWADEQDEGVKINPLWHPVVQDQLFISGRGIE